MSQDDGEETSYLCDVCDKPMRQHERCWVFKDDAPIEYSAGYGFCLCEKCHPGSLSHVETNIRKNPHCYANQAQDCLGCLAHYHDSDEPRECRCRCAVCNKPGWAPSSSNDDSSQEQRPGCENEWFVGEATLPSMSHPNVDFGFVLCPSCVPSIVMEGSYNDAGVKVDGEFSKRWFDPHLEGTVLCDVYNVWN